MPGRVQGCASLERGDHSYLVCNQGATFDNARENCRAAGLDLLVLDDDSESQFIKDHIKARTYIGLANRKGGCVWHWVANGSLTWCEADHGQLNSGFANWSPLQPPKAACEMGVADGKGPQDTSASHMSGCTVMRPDDGRWVALECETPAAFVCETPPPNAGKTLNELTKFIRDFYSHGLPGIRALEFRDDVSVKDPFSAYGDRYGLRECVDSLRPVSAPEMDPTKSPLEEVVYGQFYKGVRVEGRSYGVRRDPVTKNVKSVLGHFQHGIDIDTSVHVPEKRALSRAIASVYQAKASDYSPPPKGELRVFATKTGPSPEWEIAWFFKLPAILPGGPLAASVGERPAYSVFVSAKSGATLTARAWIFQ